MTQPEKAVQRKGAGAHALIFVYGILMGAANVIPGVSGGTMAFILGIYEELLSAIQSVNGALVKAVFRFDLKKIDELFPWKFVLFLFLGIGVAAVSLAKGLLWLLSNYPIYVWAFFFGLILASIWVVRVRVKSWGAGAVVSLVAFTIGMYFFVGLVPSETPDAWWFIFLCGAVAICTMILPGISGSFVLVLLGKYQTIMQSIVLDTLDIKTLALFGLGCVVGLISFARALKWLFAHYHDITVAAIIGLMLGSLRKIWPWKGAALETIISRSGKKIEIGQPNILPESLNTEVILAIVIAIIGLALVIGMEKAAAAIEKKTSVKEPEEETAI